MGSKKHKKDSKKKKHRSRSRSPLELGAEKERKRHSHKKHKDRKRDRSPDVEEVPVDSHLQNGDHHDSREEYSRDREMREEHQKEKRREQYRETESEPVVQSSLSPSVVTNSNADSLSIEDTNKLRVKLGLKPLELEEKISDDGKIKDDLGEFYHKPAANISEQKKSEKIRERLQERKEKRKLEQRLQTTLLADASDDEDASAWIIKSRDIEKQKKEAAKRAAMLDEMDAVFGVGALVAEEAQADRDQSYTTNQLKGLRVGHNMDTLTEGRDVVLTLADKDVLDEDKEDVLVNVNMIDSEKYKKNIEDRKKAKVGYQAYDDEEELKAAALGYAKPVLSKYDEEIDKGKAAKDRGFVIGDEDELEAKRYRQMMMRERLAGGVEKRLESLMLPELQVAADYFNEEELSAKFKKTKKRGKIRKKAKHEPIDVDEYDPNTAPLETDDTDVKPEYLKLEAVEEDEVEPDSELQVALARARRLRQSEQILAKVPKMEDILEQVKEEPPTSSESSAMVLDATAEFCRTLGDIPTYGQAGNRDSQVDIMDFELDDPDKYIVEDEASGAWSRVDVNADKPADITASTSGALDAEPSLSSGVAGALQLALSKGYLERQSGAPVPKAALHHLLTARHYSIEDKTYGEDDKHGRRERGGHCGPLQDFREKNNFKPNIKLDYVDDDGRPLCPKEAFRYLSHKFHGKGPGKNKQEKRIKKAVQEGLMKKMSSTDTPLNTLQMLQDKQKETQSPYIVLSGAKREHQ